MKTIILDELNQVSGGEKFLISTVRVDITGVPASCIERFFNSTNATLVGINEDMLSMTLLTNCTESMNPPFNQTTYDSMPIALSVIEE